MDLKDLKEYLTIVIDMEKNIYLQNNLISQMQDRIKHLGQAHVYQKPTMHVESSGGFWIVECIMGSVLALIGFLALRWGLKLVDSNFAAFLPGIFVLVLGGASLLGGIGSFFRGLWDKSNDAENYLKAKNNYDVAYAQYERDIHADQERVQIELLVKAILSSNLESLVKQNEKSKRNLEYIYSVDIIYPKYRNLIMVCSIYEYICSGRCNALEGHEGAYNILEMEIRLDHIIIQLDQVIDKLDAIQVNQYLLYSAIQETNQQVAQILQSVNSALNGLLNFYEQTEELSARIVSMEKNSALMAYWAQSIQKELQYMNRMNYFLGKYNGVFYNLPPS